MGNYNPADYTFAGLDSLRGPTGGAPFLGYVVGLVDKPDHAIAETLAAKRILSWLYEIEEQAPHATYLEARQSQFFSRFFQGGYNPRTPCMVTKAWSPIGVLLQEGYEPLVLRREQKTRSVATAIWEPRNGGQGKSVADCATAEELFWSVFRDVSRQANAQGMWVSIIAQPGWSYDSAIGSLPKWSAAEVEKAGRIIWQRTPDG